MSATGNRLLVSFLIFSMLFFAVALLVRNDPEPDSGVDGREDAQQDVGQDVRQESSVVAPATQVAAVDPRIGAEAGSVIPSAIDSEAGSAIPSAIGAEAGSVIPSAIDSEAEATAPSASAYASSTVRRDRPGDHSILGSFDFEAPARHFKLPKRLREISGLTMVEGDRLLAHDDEKGVVVKIDHRDGSIVKDFKLGGPRGLVADDLEGIAAADGRLYLVSSSGRLYEFGEGADGATVSYNRYETGIGRFYEIEGLAYDPDQRMLLLVSKNPRNAGQADLIALYRWSLETRRLVEDGHTFIETSALARRIGRKKFQPSGIERHPVSGNYIVVAARQRAVAEITPQGTVLAVRELKAGRHRQAEGISFASDHTMVIADEGAGKRATLSFYPVAKGR